MVHASTSSLFQVGQHTRDIMKKNATRLRNRQIDLRKPDTAPIGGRRMLHPTLREKVG